MQAAPVDLARPQPAPVEARLGYQAPLDGLRAIAVVAVMLYHGGVRWSSGGFLGVDVFFVLSGFLISTLLVEEWRRTGAIDVRAFYGRRARRLFPAMVPVLVAVAGYALWLAPDGQLEQLRGEVLATLVYVNNWHLVAQEVGYFDAFAAPSPLTHTWSLAVEEQWYLIWPLVVAVLLGRRGSHRGLTRAVLATGVLCGASAVWMATLASPGTDPSRVYYGTDTRAQELLLGSLLAFAAAAVGTVRVPGRWRVLLDVAGIASLGVTLWLCTVVDASTRWLYEGGMLVVGALVAVVIVAALQPGGLLRRALGTSPLPLIGLGSYGLYLWHLPVYVVLSADRTGLAGTRLLLLRLAASAALALVSYHLIERPIRQRRRSARPFLVLGPPVALAAVVTIVVAAIGAPPAAPVLAAPGEVGAHAATSSAADTGDESTIFRLEDNPPPAPRPADRLRVVMTGDSVALTLSAGFAQRSDDARTVMWDHSILGCPLFESEMVFLDFRTSGPPQCGPWRDFRPTWLGAFRPHVVLVLSSVWETWDKVVDGRELDFGSPAFDRWFSQGLDDLIATFSTVGARTVLLTAPCNERAPDLAGNEPPENDEARLAHINSLYRAAADRNGDAAAVIELAERVCPDGEFDASLRTEDGVHFNPSGADRVRDWLLPRVAELRPPGD